MKLAWVRALRPERLPSRSIAFDVGLGLLLTPYLAIATFGVHLHYSEPVAIYIIEGIAVCFRRAWTLLAAALSLVVAGTSEVTQWPYPIGVGIVIYTIAAKSFHRRLVWAFTLICAILLVLSSPFSVVERSPKTLGQIIPEAALITIGPMLGGLYIRERQSVIDALSQRAEDAERQRVFEAERIRADERTQLANEIHDVVAHTVSLMVVHTGALTVAATDSRTRELAEHIRAAGSTALEELRDLVGVLRAGQSSPLGPTPNLENLPALIEDARAAGTTVQFFESGLAEKVPGPVERTTYRLIQESLTNARKHAAGATVTINLTWRPTKVVISIHNDLPASKRAFPASGHGLEGLSQRIALLSGHLSSGPTADGGWTVSASMPLGGPE